MKQAQNVPKIRRVRYSLKFVENEVTFVMWFMYEYVNMLYGFIMTSEEKEDVLTFIKRR